MRITHLCVLVLAMAVAACSSTKTVETLHETRTYVQPEESTEFSRHASKGTTKSCDDDGTERTLEEDGFEMKGNPSLIREWIRANAANPQAIDTAAANGVGGISAEEMKKLLVQAGWTPPGSATAPQATSWSQPTTSTSYSTGGGGYYGGVVNYRGSSSSSDRPLHFVQPSDVMHRTTGKDGIRQWTYNAPSRKRK